MSSDTTGVGAVRADDHACDHAPMLVHWDTTLACGAAGICGSSRPRAYAQTGDALASEPRCRSRSPATA